MSPEELIILFKADSLAHAAPSNWLSALSFWATERKGGSIDSGLSVYSTRREPAHDCLNTELWEGDWGVYMWHVNIPISRPVKSPLGLASDSGL